MLWKYGNPGGSEQDAGENESLFEVGIKKEFFFICCNKSSPRKVRLHMPHFPQIHIYSNNKNVYL